jgi:deazaflavin-dependent oxidoreductase (nitroreductase family)
MNAESQPRYVEPSRSTRIFNSAVGRLTRMGVSVYGSRVLAVRGRKSGEWRTTPVNPLTLDGQRYLISPRGNTQWVRNMRVAGGGELRVGRRVEKFTATELPVQERPAVLRAYLKKWVRVGMFFQGVGPDSPEDKVLAIAPDHPVFRIRS